MGRLSGARARIFAWLIGLVLLAVAGSSLAARQILLLQIHERIDKSLYQEVEEITRLLDGRNPETGQPFGDDIAAIFDVFLSRNVPEEDEFFITLLNGQLYTPSPAALPPSLQLQRSLVEVWASLDRPQKDRVSAPPETLIYLAYPIQTPGGNRGVFVVLHGLTNRQQDLDRVILIVTTVMLCTFVLALGLAWITTGKVLAPLQLLTQTARSIKSADHQLERRIVVQGSDEIAELTETFNAMLDRLQTSFISQRDFINDASHELQTPITVIQGHLELLSQHPTDQGTVIWLMQDELHRMSRLVKDLLLLARAERPDFLTLEMVKVDDLVQTIYAKATAIAPRQWLLSHRAAVKIVADRDRITQAMMNLIKNAVEHTETTDHIELGSKLIGDQVHFWVRDSGSGIAAADQPRIFQRFARGAGGRPRSDGSGLGLAIVQAIVEAHGGHIEVHSAPRAGALFTLLLPLEPPRNAKF